MTSKQKKINSSARQKRKFEPPKAEFYQRIANFALAVDATDELDEVSKIGRWDRGRMQKEVAS